MLEGKTILVVDDDPIVLKLVQKRLSVKEKLNVLIAGSGKEALGVLETQKPDFITLDHMMPDMDGITLCKAIKSKAKIADIPVLFFTCYHAYGFESSCESAGAKAVIFKDELTDLIEALRGL